MRSANISARYRVIHRLAFVAICCVIPSQPIQAQYIYFRVPNAEGSQLRDIDSDDFEKEKANIESCSFLGEAHWLVEQQDANSHLHELPKLYDVWLLHHIVSREELKYIASLDNVEVLYIGVSPEGVGVAAESLCALKEMKRLTHLNLCVHALEHQHLRFLDGCKKLSSLTIESPSDWQWLQDSQVKGELTDSSADYIAAVESLEALVVRFNDNLSDQFIAPLSKLPKLRELTIDSPLLTDDALRLVALKLQLEHLSISSPEFTDEGVVKWLTQSKTLRHLEIKSPNLTQKSVDALKQLDLRTLTVNNRFVIREPSDGASER